MGERFVSPGTALGMDTDTQNVDSQISELPGLMVTLGRDPGRHFRSMKIGRMCRTWGLSLMMDPRGLADVRSLLMWLILGRVRPIRSSELS